MAKDLLTRAFASTTIQKFDVLEKLANLSLKYNGSCFAFVSEMQVITHTFDALEISVEDILQFFFGAQCPMLSKIN